MPKLYISEASHLIGIEQPEVCPFVRLSIGSADVTAISLWSLKPKARKMNSAVQVAILLIHELWMSRI